MLVNGCDAILKEGQILSSTSSAVQTIQPATLTAISEAAELEFTAVPNPMGVPRSALEGLELDFWYVWDLDEPGVGMNAIVNRFNQENEWGITVNAVDQGLSLDPRMAIETAFMEDLMPDLMISSDLPIAGWYDDEHILDLNPFAEDPIVGLTSSDLRYIYPGIFDTYLVRDGSRPGFPFAQSIQVLYYNQSWGKEMGFSTPPANSEEIYQQSCAAVEFKAEDERESQPNYGGVILYPDAANVTSWIFAYNGSLLDQSNGDFNFVSREIQEVGQDWIELKQDGCGFMISGYPNPMVGEIELERFSQREALLIMGSSQIHDQIHTGANQTGRPDDWVMIPFVGPDGDKAVLAEIQSIVIFDKSPAEELGAWLFLNFLIHPETQAEWAEYSRYYPIRRDALRFLRGFRTENPHWAQGLNLLKYSRANPLHPSWEIVQQALGDAFEEILLSGSQDLLDLLRQLDQTAAELVLYTRD
jgi:ABC-type glycerol-3-phosphate transport system substrate-binding protein